MGLLVSTQRLSRLGAHHSRLENPYSVIEYSSDKIYLADVEARGLPIIPSHFVAVGETPEFFVGDFVVKPRVGAGSNDALRFREGEEEAATRHIEALHEKGRDVLIQPYIHSVDTIGERALIFIDGEYSHAIAKGAMLNVPPDERDFAYRRKQVGALTAEDDAISTASRVLSTMGFDSLLYARVDLVATIRGWLVMELELVEPSLFLPFSEVAASLWPTRLKRDSIRREAPSPRDRSRAVYPSLSMNAAIRL